MFGMKRREFVRLLGGAAVARAFLWPLAAQAQQSDRMQRIGVLLGLPESDLDGQSWLAVFRQRLSELGWTDGRDVRIDSRFGGSDANRIRTYAAELVGLAPDAIFVNSQPVLDAMRQATRTIPIVFVQVSDPVGQGIISSLARPGGNVTGFASTESAMAGKWLELLKGIAPRVSQLAVILNPENASNAGHFHAIEAVAPSVGVQVTWAGVRNATEIEPAIDVIARKTNAGLIVLASPTTNSNRELIVTLAARRHLPAVYPFRYFVTSGGLMSYGPNVPDLYRQAASYVDRILRGAKPSELPVQNPARFELVINLNTAKALGLDVPLHLQQLADDVIE